MKGGLSCVFMVMPSLTFSCSLTLYWVFMWWHSRSRDWTISQPIAGYKKASIKKWCMSWTIYRNLHLHESIALSELCTFSIQNDTLKTMHIKKKGNEFVENVLKLFPAFCLNNFILAKWIFEVKMHNSSLRFSQWLHKKPESLCRLLVNEFVYNQQVYWNILDLYVNYIKY